MARRVSWTNNSSGHSGTYVYRAPALDPQALPEPIAQVGPVAQGAAAEWLDGEELAAGDYEYAVQDFDGQGVGQASAIHAHSVPLKQTEARYWRVYTTKTRDAGDYKVSLARVQFRTTEGVGEINTGTPFASSALSSAYNASKVFDDLITTVWLPATGAPLPQWVGIDIGQIINVAEIMLQAANDDGGPNRGPEDFEIQKSSDGTNWEAVRTITGEPVWAKSEIRTYLL